MWEKHSSSGSYSAAELVLIRQEALSVELKSIPNASFLGLIFNKVKNRGKLMKTTCLINNYNYDSYVLEAVNSALNQTVSFDEIVVVDDGSTDCSAEILEQSYASNPNVKLVIKENGGQLSCFQAGLKAASGDIFFFLDADDFYAPNYLEEALQVYQDTSCDFLFCSHKDVKQHKGEQSEERIHQVYNKTLDLGYSVILSTWANGNHYLGNVTSTLSSKKEFLARLFPYPFMSDWRIQADLYLIFGSSMAGAKKAYCHQPLVTRRIHGKNLYAKAGYGSNLRPSSSDRKLYYNNLRRARFKHILKDKLGIDPSFIQYIDIEFKTIDEPTPDTLNTYLKIVDRTNLSVLEKMRKKLSIYRHYLSRRSKYSQTKRSQYIANKP